MNSVNILGHRGNQEVGPENSFESIRDCFTNINIDGTELDIRLTKDRKIIVNHDSKINGLNIHKTTFDKLKTQGCMTKTNYMCLESAIGLCEDKRLLIDLKGSLLEYGRKDYEYLLEYLAYLLTVNKDKDIFLQSYRYHDLIKLKEKHPDINIVMLIDDIRSEFYSVNPEFDGIDIKYNCVTQNIVEQVLRYEMELFTWDPDETIGHVKKANNIINKYYRDFASVGSTINIINFLPEQMGKLLKK